MRYLWSMNHGLMAHFYVVIDGHGQTRQKKKSAYGSKESEKENRYSYMHTVKLFLWIMDYMLQLSMYQHFGT